jgi:hypothetical protein
MEENMRLLLALGFGFFVAICVAVAYVFYLAPNSSDDLK